MDTVLEFNHISLLQHRAKHSGNTILLRVPVLRGLEPPQQWDIITVGEFAADVDVVAKFLLTELNARAIPLRSAVSLLSSGSQYRDLVYAIALARASYIPHFCTMLTNPAVVFELMEKAGSKMILYDPSSAYLTANCPFPKMALISIESIRSTSAADGDFALPRVEDLFSSSDIGFIYHTSGSTSGSPKLIPWTHKAFTTTYKIRAGVWLEGERFDTPDVFLGLASISHRPGMAQYLRCLDTGSSFIKPSMVPLPNAELLNMFNLCKLNRMTTYGTWLAPHISAAKEDPAMLNLLQKMRTISYTGVAISSVVDDWCFHNDIPLVGVLGTTECGPLMASGRRQPSRFLRPFPSIPHRFNPVTDITVANLKLDNPASTQLFEFILLSNAPKLPPAHLLSPDGNYHSGDFFEQQTDGSYVFCGRNDDWIKNADTDRVNTKIIEDHIYETCSDVVKECIVVGSLRPSPALFVEVHNDKLSEISEDCLKETILGRMTGFHARLYEHEKITDKRLIFMVEEGVLPRTLKGNFRRRAIEEKYVQELDAMYKAVCGS